MGDAYEPIGGLGDGEPMIFAPPPPQLPPPPPPPPPSAAKIKGDKYVPPPPPSPGSEVSKSQVESNIGAPSGIGDPSSGGDFIQSTKTRHGNMDEMGDGRSTRKKKKPKKSSKRKCCMVLAWVIFLVSLVATIVMTLMVFGLIKF